MSQQANLNFLGNDTLTADPTIVSALMQTVSTSLPVNHTRDRTRFILGATVSQRVMYATLPYEVVSIYTRESNTDNNGEQNRFFIKDVGKISEIKLLDTGDQIKPNGYQHWAHSSSSLGIDHECFFPTEYIDLCTKLIQPFMLELAASSHRGEEMVRLWTQLCSAQGNITLLTSIIAELERTATKIYSKACVLA